jgi:ATP-dependent DNA ligase
MSMLHFEEIKEEVAKKLKDSDYIIQRKYDGFRCVWINNHLYSERAIIQDDKFKHIYNELINNFKDCILDGEIVAKEEGVWNINKRENWKTATYFVFDILKFKDEKYYDLPYSVRFMTLKTLINNLNHIKLVETYNTIEEALRIMKERDFEGIVIKSINQTYPSFTFDNLYSVLKEQKSYNCFKIKNWKEKVVEIIGYEEGSEKGAFITTEGKVSALCKSVAEQYKELKEKYARIFLEVEYLKKTDDGKLFQPKPKRFLVNSQKVE